MTVLFDGTLLEAVANGVAPTTGANGGIFASVVTTSGTVLASTAQAKNGTKSVKYEFTGAGVACHGITPSITFPTYETIQHTFAFYIDTIANTTSIGNLNFLASRYAIYFLDDTGWKIRFSLLSNATSLPIATPATSAVITTGAWHTVTANYKVVDATHVDLRLWVDGVLTSSLNQTDAALTIPSAAGAWRIGSAAQFPASANFAIGDKFYIDAMAITADPAPAQTKASDLIMATTRGGFGQMASVGRFGCPL